MKHLLTALWFASLAFGSVSAQEVISEDDVAEEAVAEAAPASVLDEKVIPEAYSDARYQATWSSNPFLRKTVVIAGPKVDWSQDWALSSMYKSESGKITISLQNKQTGEFKRVTSEEDANSEFRLIKANFNRNRDEASAEIAKGNETATVKYDDNLTSRPVTVTDTFKQPAPAGGNPNARPGQPGAPVNPNAQPGQPVNATPPMGQQPLMGTPGPANARPLVPGAARPGIGAPGALTPQAPANAPSMSRRRQLIPAPVVPPPQPQ